MKRELRYRWKEIEHSIDQEKLDRLAADFETDFFEDVLAKNPMHVPALISLGELYTKNGRVDEGLAIDMKLSSLFPYEPVIHYNLACSLALAGRTGEAVEMLRKSINLGYDDFEAMQNDADLASVRDHPKYIELLLNLKNSA